MRFSTILLYIILANFVWDIFPRVKAARPCHLVNIKNQAGHSVPKEVVLDTFSTLLFLSTQTERGFFPLSEGAHTILQACAAVLPSWGVQAIRQLRAFSWLQVNQEGCPSNGVSNWEMFPTTTTMCISSDMPKCL